MGQIPAQHPHGANATACGPNPQAGIRITSTKGTKPMQYIKPHQCVFPGARVVRLQANKATVEAKRKGPAADAADQKTCLVRFDSELAGLRDTLKQFCSPFGTLTHPRSNGRRVGA